MGKVDREAGGSKDLGNEEEIPRLEGRPSRNLAPAGREEVTRVVANMQTHLDSQERLRMEGSGVSDSMADIKCQVEKGSWAQHTRDPGLRPSGCCSDRKRLTGDDG